MTHTATHTAFSHRRTLVAACLALLAFLVVAPSASAQLKLPHKAPEKVEPKPHGNVAPFRVCLVCGTRSYTAVFDGRKDEQGNDLCWCDACKRDTPHRSSNPGPGLAAAPSPTAATHAAAQGSNKGDGNLKLPKPKPADPAPSTATPAPTATGANAPAKPDPPPKNTPAPANAGAAAAAAFVFDEVKKARSIDDSIATKGVDTLISAGEPGLAAARRALPSDVAPVLATAARVLLRAGTEDDIQLVMDRWRLRLPAAACTPVLEELVRRDPVRAGPAYLCDLLEHPQLFAAQAAERHLRRHLSPDLLPVLEPHLASKHSEARYAALAIAADINDPGVTPLLLRMIDDSSPKVATLAVNSLATHDDAGLDAQLLGLAFRERWVLRRGAYALIAILQREDLRFQSVLDDTHVEPLLQGIDSSDPFIAGTCAAALAGIGFRSPDPKKTEWLDQLVMDHLVSTASGREFHSDFSALVPITMRRLRMVSGQNIQNDGPAWVEWWVAARKGFRARRANLAIEPAEIPAVLVRFEATGDSELFTLVGPEVAPTAESLVTSGEIVYITNAEAEEVVAGLAREGLLGSELLPGLRGLRGRGQRSLEVSVHGRTKAFTFGAGVDQPWFSRSAELVRAIHDRNSWQRFPQVGKHANSLALWQEQSAWWAADHPAAERAARLKGLVLASMERGSPAQRELGVRELERLYVTPSNIEPQDFAPLLALLKQETTQGERAKKLTRLALSAGRSAGTPTAPGGTERRLPEPLARDLMTAFCDLFGTNAADALAELFAASPRSALRTAATDTRPLVRAAVCKVLAQDPSAEDVQLLVKMLDDKDQTVQAAAATALGENKVEAARTELLVRARLGFTPVRAAALKAIGKMGGEYALDALVLGVSDKDPEVRLAAAQGLAELADPAATQILVALLGEKGDAQVFEAARNGLVKIGKATYPELIRAINLPGGKSKREAALLLAEQGVPDAVSSMIAMLGSAPTDAHLANELLVLTCVDMRSQPDPAQAWWSWWDGVRHDDALAWFRAALERVGVQSPPPGTLEGEGTQQGRLFLVGVMSRNEPWLIERARRELKRLTGTDPGLPPASAVERELWLRKLRESLESRNPSAGEH